MVLPWRDDTYLTHRSFCIHDLVGDDDLITGKTFEDCTIYGPAVIVPLDHMAFERNAFEADAESLFWEIPDGRNRVVGAIGLIDCTFRRCKFRRVGIAGKRELIDLFLQAMNV